MLECSEARRSRHPGRCPPPQQRGSRSGHPSLGLSSRSLQRHSCRQPTTNQTMVEVCTGSPRKCTAGCAAQNSTANSRLTQNSQEAKLCSLYQQCSFVPLHSRGLNVVLVDYFIKFLIPRCNTARSQIPDLNQLLR